ncbi:MAG TPA: hypothetical protein VMV10_30105 [Pirellulales bacterium]|nr:hypothetical protein [Pirellulales bacterium]
MLKPTEKTAAKKAAKKGRPRQTTRPELLPYPDFPLFGHNGTRWAKVIRGKRHYFGKVADGWQAALEKYEREREDLYAGRTPRVQADGLTVAALANAFLTSKRHLVDTGELSPHSFVDYYATCKLLIEHFGAGRLVIDLAADDFEKLRRAMAKTRGPVTLGNEITRVRVAFKYAYDAELIERPIRFGPTFRKPTKTTLRRERQKKGPRMFEAAELRQIIAAAPAQLRAMILLGANAGLGNHDVGLLPLKAIDIESGWLDFPRPKTAIHRRCWLWPETIAAVRAALAERPTPKDAAAAKLVFLTRFGVSWTREPTIDDDGSPKKAADNALAKEFRKLLDKLKLWRPGLGFYALRHSFETVAGESRDQVAVNAVMGHADSSMSAVYRERIVDDRLRAVAEHVRQWLLTADRGAEPEPAGGWMLE